MIPKMVLVDEKTLIWTNLKLSTNFKNYPGRSRDFLINSKINSVYNPHISLIFLLGIPPLPIKNQINNAQEAHNT
jgi:hypothetical protein